MLNEKTNAAVLKRTAKQEGVAHYIVYNDNKTISSIVISKQKEIIEISFNFKEIISNISFIAIDEKENSEMILLKRFLNLSKENNLEIFVSNCTNDESAIKTILRRNIGFKTLLFEETVEENETAIFFETINEYGFEINGLEFENGKFIRNRIVEDDISILDFYLEQTKNFGLEKIKII